MRPFSRHFCSCKRSRWRRTVSLLRPSQDILPHKPQTHRRRRKRRRTSKHQAAAHSRTDANRKPTLHWNIFESRLFLYSCRVSSRLLHFTALLLFAKASVLCFSLTVHIVNILISIWMLRVFQSAFIDSTRFWYFKKVSGQYSSLWYYLLSLLYTLLLFNKHLLRKSAVFDSLIFLAHSVASKNTSCY